MELLHELPNGDSITLSEVRQVLTEEGKKIGDFHLPNRMVIHTERGVIWLDTGTFSQAQSFRTELVKAVNSARTKEEPKRDDTREG